MISVVSGLYGHGDPLILLSLVRVTLLVLLQIRSWVLFLWVLVAVLSALVLLFLLLQRVDLMCASVWREGKAGGQGREKESSLGSPER